MKTKNPRSQKKRRTCIKIYFFRQKIYWINIYKILIYSKIKQGGVKVITLQEIVDFCPIPVIVMMFIKRCKCKNKYIYFPILISHFSLLFFITFALCKYYKNI